MPLSVSFYVRVFLTGKNKNFYKFRESGCKNIPFVGHLSDREAGKGAAMPAPGAFRRSRYDNHNRQFHKIEDGSIDF